MEISRKTIEIGLLWHSLRSENLGVGALSTSNIALIHEAAQAEGLQARFTVFSFDDKGGRYVLPDEYVIEEIVITSRSLLPGSYFRKALGSMDLLFDVGAGDSFADIYGQKRFFYIWIAQLLVRRADRRLTFSPQTIGPFNSAFGRAIASLALRRARMIWTRDTLSLKEALSLSPEAHVALSTDLAFALPYEKSVRPPGGPRCVGVNVSALLLHGGYTRSNQFGLKEDYSDLIHRLLERISTDGTLECHLIPHVLSNGNEMEDDYRASAALGRKFDVVLPPPFKNPIEAKSYIATMDVLVGSRMHATIAAVSAGVATVPLAYSRKFAGLFADLDYPICIDLRTTCTVDTLAAVFDVIAAPEQYRLLAEQARDRADRKLSAYTTYLRDVIGNHHEAA